MADNYRVVYKAIAEFASVRREVRQLKKEIAELRAEESSLNSSSASGASRSATSRRQSTRAAGEEGQALRGVAAAAVAAAAASRQHGSATDTTTRSVRRAASTTAGHVTALAAQTAAMHAAQAAADDLGVSVGRIGRSGNTNWMRQSRNELGQFTRAAEGAASAAEGVGRAATRGTKDVENAARRIKEATKHFQSFMSVLGAIGKIAAIGAGIAGLISMLAPLTTALGAVTAAAVSTVASLGSLVGALTAIGPIGLAAATGIGAMVAAFQNVGDTFKAFSKVTQDGGKTSRAAAKQVVDATKSIADAENNLFELRRNAAKDRESQARSIKSSEKALISSQKDVRRAQDDLTASRKEALQNIRELRQEVSKAALDEQQAQVNIVKAQEALRGVLGDPSSSAGTKQQALIDVRKAEQDLSDVRAQAAENQRKLSEAERKGVEGNDQVVAAREEVKAANDRVRQSEEDLRQTQQQVAESQRTSAIQISQAIQAVAQAQQAAVQQAQNAATAEDELAKSLDKLSPSARAVVLGLHGMGDAWKQIRLQTQENFFAPIAGQLGNINGFLPTLNTLLGQAAGAFGNVAARAVEMFTSGPFQKDFQSASKTNVFLIETIGDAALKVVDAFRNIAMAAIPFTRSVASGLKEGADNFARFMANARDTGKLATWLSVVRERLSQWWQILKNIGITFANVGRAASGLTGSLTESLVKITRRWRDMSDQSTASGKKLHDFFTNIRPLITEVAKLFGDTGRGFANIVSDPRNINNAIEMLRRLREGAHGLADFVQKIDFQSFGSKLMSIFSNIGRVVSNLFDAGLSGTFSNVLTIVDGFTRKLAELTSNAQTLPFIQKLGAGFGILAGALAIGKFTGLNSLVTGLGTMAIKSDLLGKSLAILPGWLKLVALGIAGAAAASPEFRDELASAGRSILESLKPLLPMLLELGKAVVGAFQAILPTVVSVFNALLTALQPLIGGITVVIGWIAKIPPGITVAVVAFGLLAKAIRLLPAAMGPFGIAAAAVISFFVAVANAVKGVSGQAVEVQSGYGVIRRATDDLANTIDRLSGSYTAATKAAQLLLLQQQRSITTPINPETGKPDTKYGLFSKTTAGAAQAVEGPYKTGKTFSTIDDIRLAGVSVNDYLDALNGVPEAQQRVSDSMAKGKPAFLGQSDAYQDLITASKTLGVELTFGSDTMLAAAKGVGFAKAQVEGFRQRVDEAAKAQLAAGQISQGQYDQIMKTAGANATASGAYQQLINMEERWNNIASVTTNMQTAISDATAKRRQEMVDLGLAVSYVNGILTLNNEQFLNAYNARENQKESINDFIKRMKDSGIVVQNATSFLQYFKEQANNPGGTSGIDAINDKLKDTISLADSAENALAKALAKGAADARNPKTLYERTKARLNQPRETSYSSPSTNTPTYTPETIPSANIPTYSAPPAVDYEAQNKAREAASKAQDAQLKGIDAVLKKELEAADKLKKVREQEIDLANKAAQAAADAADKKVLAAQQEVAASTKQLDAANFSEKRAQDAVDTARGDVYAAQKIRLDAEKALAGARTASEKQYFQGVVTSADADEKAARARLKKAEADQRVAKTELTKAKTRDTAATGGLAGAQRGASGARSTATRAQEISDKKRTVAEDDYAKAVEKANARASKARDAANAAYQKALDSQQAAAAKASNSLTQVSKTGAEIAKTSGNTATSIRDDNSSIVDSYDGMQKEVEPTVKDMLKQMDLDVAANADWSKTLRDVAKRVPPEVAEELANLGPEALPMLKQLQSMTDTELSKWATSFSLGTDSAMALMQEAIKAATPGMQSDVDGLTPDIAAKILKDMEDGKKPLSQIAEEYGVIIRKNASGEVVITMKPTPKKDAQDWAKKTLDSVQSGIDSLIDKLGIGSSGISNKLGDMFGGKTTLDNLKEFGKDLWDRLTDPFKDKNNKPFWEKARDGIEGVLDGISLKSAGKKAYGDFTSPFQKTKGYFSDKSRDAGTGIKQWGPEFGRAGKENWDKIVGPFKDTRRFFQGKANDAKSGFGGLSGGMGSIALEGMRAIGRVTGSIGRFFQGKAGEAGTGFAPAGKSMGAVALKGMSLIGRTMSSIKSFFSIKANEVKIGFAPVEGGLSAPIKSFIDKGLNKGLIPALNNILKFTGSPVIQPGISGGLGQRRNSGGQIFGVNELNGGGRARRIRNRVPGIMGPDRDSVNAYLTPGEFVIRRRAVKKIGLRRLHEMNNLNAGGLAVAGFDPAKLNKASSVWRMEGSAASATGSWDQMFANIVKPVQSALGYLGTSPYANMLRAASTKTQQAIESYLAGAGGTGFQAGSGNWGPENYSGLAANTAAAKAFVTRQFGISSGDIGGWSPSGSVATSDHPKGKAIDVMIAGWKTPSGIAKGNTVADWFVDHPKSFGTKYVIWRNRIDSGSGWRPYTRSDRGNLSNPTLAHMDHVHVSFLTGPSGSLAPPSNLMAPPGSGVMRWAPIVTQALKMTGQYSPGNLQATLYRMNKESSGNPAAINKWDRNWVAGTPSKGLMQVIDPTFRTFAMPGYNRNIWDPLSNVLASIRYAMVTYRSLPKAYYRSGGYNDGGLVELLNGGGLAGMMDRPPVSIQRAARGSSRTGAQAVSLDQSRRSAMTVESLVIHNPKAERAKDSLIRQIRRTAYLGRVEVG